MKGWKPGTFRYIIAYMVKSFRGIEFNPRILDCLNNIKGSGSFVSCHTAAFLFPGLEVTERVGPDFSRDQLPQKKGRISATFLFLIRI
jgi:hypothetical protein